MGRRTKLTPTIQETIVRALRLGMYQREAAQAAGIGDSTYFEWLQRGEQQKSGVYAEFADAVKKAMAEGEQALLARIQMSANEGTWQAAAWILERRYRERWGRSVEVRNSEPVKVALTWGAEDGGDAGS